MEKIMKVCNDSKVANTNASIEANINANRLVSKYKAFNDFVVNQLKNVNNKLYKGILIDKAQITDIGYDIPVIAIKLHNKIDCYIYDDYGNHTLGNTSIMYVSIYTFIPVLQQKTDVDIDKIIDNPEVLENVLAGATIDILQIPVRCGDAFVGPFTNQETLFDKDVMIKIITNVHLNQ